VGECFGNLRNILKIQKKCYIRSLWEPFKNVKTSRKCDENMGTSWEHESFRNIEKYKNMMKTYAMSWALIKQLKT